MSRKRQLKIGTGNQGFSLVELVVALGIGAVLMAVAIPRLGTFSATDDARTISNALSFAKISAASHFSKARLYVDLVQRTQRVEFWQKTAPIGWTMLNGLTTLSSGNIYSFAQVASAPANTQGAIAQAPLCQDNASVNVANTACIVFNSRGVPVDTTGAPTSSDAIYVTDGSSVKAVTVSSGGLILAWHTPLQATPTWDKK